MHYLILADIHANFQALQAIVDVAGNERVDKYIILGDVVDYGAEPNESLQLLSKLAPQETVRGDHEKWHTKILGDDYLSDEALTACRWTQKHLGKEGFEYIKSFPAGPRIIDKTFMIVHGSYEGEDDYIIDNEAVVGNFGKLKTKIGFFGHTHVPVIFCEKSEKQIDAVRVKDGTKEHQLDWNNRYLINPGSAGQPRDHDPRTSFAIFDSDGMVIKMFRIPYDHETAAKKIVEAGLPADLAQRLIAGF